METLLRDAVGHGIDGITEPTTLYACTGVDRTRTVDSGFSSSDATSSSSSDVDTVDEEDSGAENTCSGEEADKECTGQLNGGLGEASSPFTPLHKPVDTADQQQTADMLLVVCNGKKVIGCPCITPAVIKGCALTSVTPVTPAT